MKKKWVIIGIVIAAIVSIATIIIHNFIIELPLVLATSLIAFSALLFTFCIIGNKKRKEQEEGQKSDGK